MEASLQTLVHHLFKKNSIKEVELSEIEEFVNKYPYANAGRVVLAAKKFYLHPAFQDEVHTAALYLKNPLWLEQLLQESADCAEVQVNPVEVEAVSSTPIEAPKELELGAGFEDQPEQVLIAEVASEPEDAIQIAGTIVIEEDTEIREAQEIKPEATELVAETDLSETKELTEDPPVVTIHKLPTLSAVAVENTVSLIEPYHTIDYFASQGIKVKLEDLDKDKFGRQLKSFTEWLRTMKKVTKVAENVADEAVVVKQAENSIENTEVETEAMAEVWLKQGKTARAKAIYRKLSLLNPEKSAYFASKIDQIKD